MSEAQIQAAIGKGFLVSDFLRQQGGIEGDSLISRTEEFINAVGTFQGPRSASALSGMSSVRGLYANAVNTAPQWLAPLLREYAEVLDFPDKDMTRIMIALYNNFNETGKRVKSRGFTFDSINVVGSPAGDGTIFRLTKDENNYDIENTFAQTIEIQCVQDQNSGGVKFKESFRFRGGAAAIDNIVISGSDSDLTFPGISSDDTQAFFQNASFSSLNGSGDTKFDFWTISSGSNANFTQDSTKYYQQTPGDPVAMSLKIAADGQIDQAFSLGNTQFAPAAPIFAQLPIYAVGVTPSTVISLILGNVQADYVVSGAESDWVTLQLGIDQDNWYKNIALNGGKLSIKTAGMATASAAVYVDNVLVAPFQPFDGLWYAPVAGQVPFKVDDAYFFVDTAVDAAILQRLFVQHTGYYLPPTTTPSAITWPEPTP